MNIARASPFNYRNGRIRSSRRQLCWLYCDSMQIPPTAILQPIARTISSIVFPASPDRATNRKNDRFIAFYSGTVIPLYILLHNPHHPAFVISVALIAASFYAIHTHVFVIKIHSENHAIEIAFSFISISHRTKIVNGSTDLYFSLETHISFPRIVQRLG